MKKKILITLFCVFNIAGVLDAQNDQWLEMAVFEGKEIYIDTTTVRREGVEVTVWVKELYTKDFEKNLYVSKLEKSISSTSSGKKSWEKKWKKKFANLHYTLSKRVYNCINSQFQVLEVCEYDKEDKRIVKTSTKKKKAPWRNIEFDTIGDILMFEVCDNY